MFTLLGQLVPHDQRMAQLVTTTQAATELGISRRTLAKWWADHLVEPDFVTAGGHARWDVDRLRTALRELRQRDE